MTIATLDSDKISSRLTTKYVGSEILVYKETASTQSVAAGYAKNENNHGLAIFAESQTRGRGRLDRKWQSDTAESILCSVILSKLDLSANLLSLTAAVACAETIGTSAKIKWPNDIMISDKKIAGILIEAKITAYGNAFIVGVGINCHQQIKDFPSDIAKIATSVDIETKSQCDRNMIARKFLISLENWLDIALDKPAMVIDRWRSLNNNLNQRITVICDNQEFAGHCTGIDPDKGLIIQLDCGSVRMFDAAKTTVKK